MKQPHDDDARIPPGEHVPALDDDARTAAGEDVPALDDDARTAAGEDVPALDDDARTAAGEDMPALDDDARTAAGEDAARNDARLPPDEDAPAHDDAPDDAAAHAPDDADAQDADAHDAVADAAGLRASPTAYRGTAGDGSGRGRIVLAATPIGNMGDATERLIGLLHTADVVAAEDTRRLHRLVQALGVTVTGRVISYHEHNEAQRTPELVELVRDGATLLMVTDAGMPSVSDPGYRLVEAAIADGVDLTVVPGASAVLAALAVSGLASDRFCFEGFLPRKPGLRAGRLADLSAEQRTMVFFEAPHRLEPMLRSLQQAFGSDRPAAVARELTKVHEQVVRGPLLELLQWAQDTEVRGEVAVVVAGVPDAPPSRPEDHVADVNGLIDGGMRLKDAVAAVAAQARVSKRELYAAVIAAR